MFCIRITGCPHDILHCNTIVIPLVCHSNLLSQVTWSLLLFMGAGGVSWSSHCFLCFQSNAILLLDTTGRAIRRLILPVEEFASKKSSWWSKEDAVRTTRFVGQIDCRGFSQPQKWMPVHLSQCQTATKIEGTTESLSSFRFGHVKTI